MNLSHLATGTRHLRCLCVALACVLLWGCKKRSSRAIERSVAVKLLEIQPKKLQTRIAVFGQTEPLAQAALSFLVAGIVRKVKVEEGSPVKKGALLAELDKESIMLNVKLSRARYYEAATSYRKIRKGYRKEIIRQQYAVYLQARANFKKAKVTYEANVKLKRSGGVSNEQFTAVASAYRAAKAQRDQAWQSYRMHARGHQKEDIQTAGIRTSQARTQLAQAKKQLKDASLKAPFAGVIAAKKVERGEFVNPGAPAFVLMNLAKIRIRVGVPERVIDALRHDQKAIVSFRAGKTAAEGKLNLKGVMLDKATLTYPVEVIVPNPVVRVEKGKPIYKILPGKVALVIFPRQRAKVGISVPLDAVLHDGKQKFVYVNQQGKARRVAVTTGKTYRNELVIRSGLKAGDQVVVSGQHQLDEGRKLYIIGATSRSAESKQARAPRRKAPARRSAP